MRIKQLLANSAQPNPLRERRERRASKRDVLLLLRGDELVIAVLSDELN